ncbi:MAG: hypothetical protein H0T05_02625 [Acidobacteria bacterium]|nr:hypothetical protein [Acidobacteriota bacterium]MBA3887102.1 hypothetical protein [Acidobacteriota bacterium]
MIRERLARTTGLFHTRAALGLQPVTAPVILYIPLGILLGPAGIGVISIRVLGHLDAVISIALATLGLFIGIAATTEGGARKRLLLASTAEAGVTMVAVGASILVLLGLWGLPTALPPVIVALALGISASTSAAPSIEIGDERARRIAARVADLDDVLPILVGSVVIAMLGSAGMPPALGMLATIGIGLLVAVAGWLLLERSHGAERGVFVLGTIALLGGCAAYLQTSPLLSGLVAGWFWALTSGKTDRVVTHELRKVQHPLIVLLLVAAGAGLTPTMAGMWLFAPYVVFRVAGKLMGGWAASRIAPGIAPSDLGAYLIPPGVIGIAFALNLQQVAPGTASALIFAVALGAIASELLAVIVLPDSRPA